MAAVGEKGYGAVSNNGENSIFTQFITNPFYPLFEENEVNGQTNRTVKFSKAYIFDYQNSDSLLAPIEVTSGPWSLNDEEDQEFYVEITFSKFTGKVMSARIVDGDMKVEGEGEEGANHFKKLRLTSEFDSDSVKYSEISSKDGTPNTEDPKEEEAGGVQFKWYILLAKFVKGEPTELFLRDNIHLSLPKFRQLGVPVEEEAVGGLDGVDNQHYPLIASYDNSLASPANGPNGVIAFNALTAYAREYDDGQSSSRHPRNGTEIIHDIERGVLRIRTNVGFMEYDIQENSARIAAQGSALKSAIIKVNNALAELPDSQGADLGTSDWQYSTTEKDYTIT